jgi:hypothetical protein
MTLESSGRVSDQRWIWISVDTPSVIAWREGLILTETLDPVAKQTSDTQELAQQLLEQARTEGGVI